MIEITGTYNKAKVFTDKIDARSRVQLENLCCQEFARGCSIRIMPNVHPQRNCPIGTTMTINRMFPAIFMGRDIGCGVEVLIIQADCAVAEEFDPMRLEEILHLHIPNKWMLRNYLGPNYIHDYSREIDLSKLRCARSGNNYDRDFMEYCDTSNAHFIEAGRDDERNLYIIIHSGNNDLGKAIIEYYCIDSWRQCKQNWKENQDATAAAFIQKLKSEVRRREIPNMLKEFTKESKQDEFKSFINVQQGAFDDYIHDIKIVQDYALACRKTVMEIIKNRLKISQADEREQFSSIHKYIDTDMMIFRSGAVSAGAGEKFIIALNMRDGCLLCEGLGNADWNYSAPGYAGRCMSLRRAAESLSLDEYQKMTAGIFCTTVGQYTLSQSPLAYKPADEIIRNIAPTAKVLKIIKPIYNYKL